jgi:glutamine cyclotransferase
MAGLASACSGPAADVSVVTVDASLPDSTPASLSGELSFEIVARYPHLTSSFTQGLEFGADGRLVESVGLFEKSGRAIVDLESGSHLEFVPLEDSLFGEGITEVGDELFQISWLAGVAIVSDSQTLVEKRRLDYEGEGWGICFNGTNLATSNGSTELTLRDPESFTPVKFLQVTAPRDDLLGQLNELECIGEQIWANVYFKEHIVAIDSATGEVEAWVDLSALVPSLPDDLSVLNGIAYRSETNTFFVTGKNWPELFELRLTGS